MDAVMVTQWLLMDLQITLPEMIIEAQQDALKVELAQTITLLLLMLKQRVLHQLPLHLLLQHL
jgi:hypothetical protein